MQGVPVMPPLKSCSSIVIFSRLGAIAIPHFHPTSSLFQQDSLAWKQIMSSSLTLYFGAWPIHSGFHFLSV